MTNLLPHAPVPAWLANLTAARILGSRLPLLDLLADSVFYPACDLDGVPVKYLAGNYHSFVYADYNTTSEKLGDELISRGLLGYNILARRDVAVAELAPPPGWTAPDLTPDEREGLERHLQGDLARARPFVHWVVFQRDKDHDDTHGPERVSLLFLKEEAVHAHDSLYRARGIRPGLLVIVRPGVGFGLAWTDFREWDAPLARSLRYNTAGMPPFMVTGDDWTGPIPGWPYTLVGDLHPARPPGQWSRPMSLLRLEVAAGPSTARPLTPLRR